MITDLHYQNSDGIMLKGKLNGKEISVRFDDILPYWEYATEDDFERGSARIFGNKILFTIITAKGQGGIVVLWNAETRKIEHISDACFTLAFDMDEHYIYFLKDVCYWGMKANLQIWKIPLGCMDAWKEADRVNTTKLPSADFTIQDDDTFSIKKRNQQFELKIKNHTYIVDLLI